MRLQFDRGTILVSDVPSALDLTDAPGLLWDARVRAHRAPAFKYSTLIRWLLDQGVTFDAGSLDSHEPTQGWVDPGLRDYQAAALSAWELAGRRGLIVLPTGSGKTRIALAALAATRLPALCLVPTRYSGSDDVPVDHRPSFGSTRSTPTRARPRCSTLSLADTGHFLPVARS
jgi:hypothetical protein